VSQVSGTVEKVSGPNKGGYFALKVDGEFYGIETKGSPEVSEGDTVRFDFYVKNGKYKTVKGKIHKKAGGGGSSNKPSSGGSRDDYWAAKDKYEKEVREPRITYFAAYERAVLFTDLSIRNGAFDALSKAKPAEKLGVLEAFVNEQAQKLIAASAGTAAEPAGEDKPATEEGGGTEDEEWT
jgi:hypothetical protein